MRLIDADVLIDHLLEVMETAKHFGNTEVSDTLCGVIGVIKGEKTIIIPIAELDTTEDFGEWIPCSERLPENINLVLVTWENTNPESYYKSIKGKKFCGAGHYFNGKWFWESSTCQDYLAEYGKCDWDEMDEAIKVIAWMPLPEPYEKEGDPDDRRRD